MQALIRADRRPESNAQLGEDWGSGGAGFGMAPLPDLFGEQQVAHHLPFIEGVPGKARDARERPGDVSEMDRFRLQIEQIDKAPRGGGLDGCGFWFQRHIVQSSLRGLPRRPLRGVSPSAPAKPPAGRSLASRSGPPSAGPAGVSGSRLVTNAWSSSYRISRRRPSL